MTSIKHQNSQPEVGIKARYKKATCKLSMHSKGSLSVSVLSHKYRLKRMNCRDREQEHVVYLIFVHKNAANAGMQMPNNSNEVKAIAYHL